MECSKCGSILDNGNKIMFVDVYDQKGLLISRNEYCRKCRWKENKWKPKEEINKEV